MGIRAKVIICDRIGMIKGLKIGFSGKGGK